MDLKRKINEEKPAKRLISLAAFGVDSLLHGRTLLRLALVVEGHLGFHSSVNGDTFKTKKDQKKRFKGPACKIWLNLTMLYW